MEVEPQNSEVPVTKVVEDTGNDANGDKVRNAFFCVILIAFNLV